MWAAAKSSTILASPDIRAAVTAAKSTSPNPFTPTRHTKAKTGYEIVGKKIGVVGARKKDKGSDMEIKILPPTTWPNFIRLDVGASLKDDKDSLISVGLLDNKTTEELCECFRKHCRDKREVREDA